MRLLLIASPGPGLQAAGFLAQRLRRAGAVVAIGGTPGTDLPQEPLALLATDLARRVDGLGLLVEAPNLPVLLRAYRQACALAAEAGAVVFSGPLEPLSGDRLQGDLLHRLEVDLLALHGPGEVEEAADLLRGSRYASVPLVPLGLWSLPTVSGSDGSGYARRLLFLEQASLPAGPNGKLPLLRLLMRLAAASPRWQLLIQPPPSGGSPNSSAAAPDEAPLSQLIQQLPARQRPANLMALTGSDITSALRACDTCTSISSPWLFHGLALGRRCLVMGDYGIRTDANMPLFFGSGLIHRFSSFSSLEELPDSGRASHGWLEQRGCGISDPGAPLLEAIATQRRP